MKILKMLLVSNLFLSVLCGCETESDCLLEIGDGINIELREAETQNPITNGKFIGFVRIENKIDSLRDWTRRDNSSVPMLLHATIGRVGRYSAFIEMEGYEPWTRDNIQIQMEECQFGSANITALLKKK